ncbi:hypothetical protein [Actinopolyspora mortivallis]|nr:hypothetical protein [Actinopolyspora mortivallis]
MTWREWWPAVGRFLVEQPPLALLGGYPLTLSVMAAAAGYLSFRRAVP